MLIEKAGQLNTSTKKVLPYSGENGFHPMGLKISIKGMGGKITFGGKET